MMKPDENETPPSDNIPTPEPARTGTQEASDAIPASDAPQDAAATEEENPTADLEGELAEAKDQLLRTLADMENLRARTTREQAQTRKFAIADFARAILSVADNLRRATDLAPDPESLSDPRLKPLVEGVTMTEKELFAILERHNIKEVAPMGEKFNHNLHQAMFEVPTADAAPGTIVEVMQIGYVLHDRLLRPAMVGVARPPAEGEDSTKPAPRVDTEA